MSIRHESLLEDINQQHNKYDTDVIVPVDPTLEDFLYSLLETLSIPDYESLNEDEVSVVDVTLGK